MLWLRKSTHLTPSQKELIEELALRFPQTPLAYQLKETFLLLYSRDPQVAEEYLEARVAWAEDCGLEPSEQLH